MQFGYHHANRDRLESLKASGLLSGRHGIDFDGVTQLAAIATKVPVSLVSLVDESRQVFAGACGLPDPLAATRQTPLSHSFCQHAVNLRRPLVIPDARAHPLVANNPAIGDFGVAAYLGFPILGAGQHLYGAVCAMDTSPRQWGEEDIEIMRGVTSIVASLIEQHLGRLYQRLLSDVMLHDLKEPLRGIQAAADIFAARAGELPVPLDETTRTLKGNADRAMALVRSILGNDRQPARCKDLHRTAEAVAAEMRPLAEKKGLLIRVEDPGTVLALELPEQVMAQVFRQLISNSIQFSDSGQVRIRIKRIGEAAVIDVEDDGPGFQTEDYPRIFQRYAPLSAKRADGEPTAGLGLAIVKALLEDDGATIVLLSRPGESAAFRITAPLRRDPAMP